MKLHLPVLLHKAIVASMFIAGATHTQVSASSLPFGGSDAVASASNYGNTAELTVTTRQVNPEPYQDYYNLSFFEISSYGLGGGIFIEESISLNSNWNVEFIRNSARDGGAIYGGSSMITMSMNDYVTFSENVGNRFGGAIYVDSESTVLLSDNESVNFEENASLAGAAICADHDSTVTLSNNQNVTFRSNSARTDRGGAIYINGVLDITNNGCVEFVANSSRTENPQGYVGTMGGGAIYGFSHAGPASVINLSDNDAVYFTGNSAYSANGSAYGGAINSARCVTIRNNGFVQFEKNVEKSDSSYRLRSVYIVGNNVLSLSAPENQGIFFYDSIYADSTTTVNINENYGDLEQRGDIVFSGEYTEAHLNEILAADGVGRTATAEEIQNSRTSEVNTMTNLYGGRLRVEEGAIYQGFGITAMEGSASAVYVRNATLNHTGYALTFSSGTTLELEGRNTIAGNVEIQEGGSLVLNVSSQDFSTSFENSLTLNGAVVVSFADNIALSGENIVLFEVLGDCSDLSEALITTEGTEQFSYFDLSWQDNTFLLTCRQDIPSVFDNGVQSFTWRQVNPELYSSYEKLTFENIASTSDGAAIYGENVSFRFNGAVIFSGNSLSSDEYGGAIYAENAITMNHNASVEFSDNSAVNGGAVYTCGEMELRGNTSVVFSNNSVSSESYSESQGGAIYADTVVLSHNDSVEFVGNKASVMEEEEYSYVCGGAISSGDGGEVTLSNNKSVLFSGNKAESSERVYGGAIYSSRITMVDNGSITFTGNSVVTSVAHGYEFLEGGAISCSYGSLFIRNNESVLFEKNAEVTQGVYRLRGLSVHGSGAEYSYDDEEENTPLISISAAAGKSVVFKDSVALDSFYIPVELNADYTDAQGVTHEQKGDIVFTGVDTEAHLLEVKGGIAGTAREIGESRTSEILATVELHGGRLCVEDGAMYCGWNIIATEGSGASVRVKDAVLSLANDATPWYIEYDEEDEEQSERMPDLLFHAGTTLELVGSSMVIGNTQMQEGSSLNLVQGDTAGVQTIIGDVALADGATVTLVPQSGAGANHVLLYVNGEISGWESNASTVNGYDGVDVTWVDELLVLNYNAGTFNRYFNGYKELAETQFGPACFHHHELVRFENLSGDTTAAGGAAICGGASSAAVLSHNKYVSFTGNEVTTLHWRPRGGAICVGGEDYGYEDSADVGGIAREYDVLLDNNGTVMFADNKIVGAYEDYTFIGGGAIFSDAGIVISRNDNVVFQNNSASWGCVIPEESEGDFWVEVQGGAIETNTLTMIDNGLILFSGNSISGNMGESGGGAILCRSALDIRNNNLVVFEKNVELSQLDGESFYHLRGLITTDWNEVASSFLSAPEGGSIVFKDSALLHCGELYMNADYVDAQGGTHEQKGDIVFTGVSTEADLLAVKGSAGTEEEISLSRMSEIAYDAYLCGGRLRVEDGASLDAGRIFVIENSKATVRLRNASIAGDLSFGRSTGLELKGRNESSGQLSMDDGSVLTLHIGAINLESPLLVHSGALTLGGSLNVQIDKAESLLVFGQYKLLTVSEGVEGWDVNNLVINGRELAVDELTWVDDTLCFNYTNQSLAMMEEDPGLPAIPEIPNEPEIPDAPVNPDEPEIPDTPVNPDEPEIPDTPVNPDEPEIPDTPVNPDEPEIPDTPVNPDEPEIPDTPVTPDKPEPLKPMKPSTPVLVGGEIGQNVEVMLTGKGSISLEGKVNAGAITVNIDKNLTFKSNKKKPGSLTGDGVLTKKGKGTLTLNDGNSSWTGDTYLEAGTIKVKGASSLGKGDVYVRGGTLNLGSKAIGNDIVQEKSASIKSGKKFTGTYTLVGGELQKGSTLNISKTATLAGGMVNGTLSGTGKTEVTGKVTLGDKGKITTKTLTLGEDATLTTSAKGLSSKSTTLSIGEEATLSLGGKMTVDSVKINGGTLKTTGSKPAAMTVKNNMELTDAVLSTNGKVTTNRLTLNASTMSIKGAKAQNLTVKQNLTIGSGSALTLNGKLSAGSLTIKKDGSLTMSGSKPVTLKVKGALTLNSGSSIVMDYNFVQGKTYKLLTFASSSGFSSIDLYDIFGMDSNACSLSNTGKAITLTVTGNMYSLRQKAVAAATTVATKPQANPVADALVQANWGQLEASRAFVNAMANRSMAVQLGNGERAVWASAIGSSSRHSSAGGHNGADTNVSGGAFGLETQVGRASLFGLALGNSWTRVSAHGFGTIEQDTTHLGLYGQTNWRSGISADWSAAYGRSESESMGSDWSQKHLQLDGRVSYNHELNARTVLSPFAGLQYYASDSAAIGTTDSGSLQNLRAEIGVGASHRTGKLGVFGEIALHQDLARNTPTVSMEGVRSTGMTPGRTGINFTIGASYELNDKWSVNASYTGEFVENANAHSANVGASYKF